jgi:hypothetical protein
VDFSSACIALIQLEETETGRHTVVGIARALRHLRSKRNYGLDLPVINK